MLYLLGLLISFNVFIALRYICDRADRADILCSLIILAMLAMLDLLSIVLILYLICLLYLLSTIPDLLTFINTFIIIEPYYYFVCPMY